MRYVCAVLLAATTVWGQERICDVRKHGGTGVRADLATAAIQAAVDECAGAGGGVALVPPGEYTSGSIELKSNVTLHLAAGATVYASRDDANFSRPGRALVWARGAKRIGITGGGTLDGQAQYEYTPRRREDEEIVQEYRIAEAAGIDMRRWNHAGPRIFLVQFIDVAELKLEDARFVNPQLWAIRLVNCEDVKVRGVYVYSDLEKAVNGDGIDLVSTRNATISDSTIITADDAICLKSEQVDGKPARPTENILVTNCILSSSSTPLMIGTETHADIRHVIFSNCVIRNSNKGVGINVQDGATVSDVLFSNLTVETGRRHWNWWGSSELFKFVLKKRTPESRLGAIRDITIDNVIAGPRGTSLMEGHPDQPIENVTIRNVRIRMLPEDKPDKRATDGMVFHRVRGLRLTDVTLSWDEKQPEKKWGSAVVFRAVSDLEVSGLATRQATNGTNAPAVLFEDTEDGIIRNCRALPGAGIFFMSKGTTETLRFYGNDLRHAKVEYDGFPSTLKGFKPY